MARAKTSQHDDAAGTVTAFPLPAGAVLGARLKQFWTVQDRILSEAETYARHWFARRHAATRAALEACEKAAAAGPADAIGVAQLLRDWQAHSLERMAEDLREWMDLWARCAGHLARGEARADAEAIDEIERESEALRSRHATPV